MSGALRMGVLGVLLLGGGLLGCFSLGPRTLARDRFDYGSAIARSRNEQMLLNIVRLRYLQVPDFLTVSSVISGYTYQGGVGAVGQAGTESFTNSFVGGSANLNYIERPTITYSPLAGEEFSRRMLKAIPIDLLFALGQSGWPPDILLRIAVQRIGKAENMAFDQANVGGDPGVRAEARKLEAYDRVVQLMLQLQDEGGFELVRGPDEAPTLYFAADMPPELREMAAELRDRLGLEPGSNSFQVTDRLTGRSPGEILVRTRSLLAILSFLARGIEVPDEDAAANRASSLPPDVQRVIRDRGPLRIRSQENRPEDPHVAIRYRDQWFYVDGGDLLSKRTFATILVLFELLAPSGGGAAPILTLPAR